MGNGKPGGILSCPKTQASVTVALPIHQRLLLHVSPSGLGVDSHLKPCSFLEKKKFLQILMF